MTDRTDLQPLGGGSGAHFAVVQGGAVWRGEDGTRTISLPWPYSSTVAGSWAALTAAGWRDADLPFADP